MKGIVKIVLRYILSAAGVTILLLLINFVILISWVASSTKYTDFNYNISKISDGLIKKNNEFILSNESSFAIDNKYKWAMLLNDDGQVIWNRNIPSDLPLEYTSSDVASFTKWYLNDYPVKVWKHDCGLFILGNDKNTIWKLGLEIPEKLLNNSSKWLLLSLIINFTVAMFLAFLFGIRFFNSLRILVKGMDDMAKKKPVFLKIKGVLKDFANNINNTSNELLIQEKLIEQRDLARNNWITGVSHDIRTPLSMIMGYSSELENNIKFSDEERKQFAIIRAQSEKIKQLINDLNLTVKLEYDMQPFNVKPFFVSEIIRKVVVEHLNNWCDEKYNLHLSISDAAQTHIINGDSRLFERSLNNIIGNSIKHNKLGCNIYINVKMANLYCLIEIKDNGIGFKEDILKNLNFCNEIPSGTSHGIGLFIVKQIVKVHNGNINFKNWENGSKITLYFP